jgi:acyl carrier protein
MFETETRLQKCFASVFPGLTLEEIRGTGADSVGIWDSLSTVTLVAVVQEEFGIEIDPGVLAQLNSFDAFRDYLCQLSQPGEFC